MRQDEDALLDRQAPILDTVTGPSLSVAEVSRALLTEALVRNLNKL